MKASIEAQTRDRFDADVLVVGTGPVGQFLAVKLAQAGHSVIVVERHPEHYPRPRAVTYDDEIARLFSGIGIDSDHDPLIESTDDWYLLRNAEREIIAEYDWRGVTPAGWHRMYWFHQPELEQRLARMVEGTASAVVRRPWEATRVRQDGDGVTLTGRTPSGEETLRGRYLVGADGANSFVRDSQGITVRDLGFFFDWLIVDVSPHEPMTFSPPVWQLCDPARPTTIVPGGPGRRRWEFMALPGEDLDLLNTEKTAWELLEPWGVHPGNATLERHVVWRFQAKWAELWQNGRVFIAGDAAHLMPPFAGQGMCAGIRDAANLAWRLDHVLRGAAAPALLDSYTGERRDHVSHFIHLSMEIGKAICVTDPDAAARRDLAMKAALADPALAPPPPPPLVLGPGVWREVDPQAGRQADQCVVRANGVQGRFDEIVGRGWSLLGWGHDPRASLSNAQAAAFSRVGGITVSIGAGDDATVLDVEGGYAAWFTELGVDTILVRPDFYVAAAVGREKLGDAMDEILGKLRVC